jgi:hypothetical protein
MQKSPNDGEKSQAIFKKKDQQILKVTRPKKLKTNKIIICLIYLVKYKNRS